MRNIDDIIASAPNAKFTWQSSPVLDICRELSIDGRFEQVAQVLAAWCKHSPQSEHYIRSRLPAIVLNCYLINRDILTFDQFVHWEQSVPEWSSSIKEHALSEAQLPAAVASVVNAMQESASNAQLKN